MVELRGENLMNRAKIEDTATLIKVLREMGTSYQETVSLLSKSLNESNRAKKLLRGENKGPISPLIKLGVTVFLVPVPVISESLGIILMSAEYSSPRLKARRFKPRTCTKRANKLPKN
jgi:hypothetical protein